MSRECSEFVEMLHRVFDAFLLRHGFQQIDLKYHGQDLKAGGPMCLVVFESLDCRLGFYQGNGEVNILVGSAAAPPPSKMWRFEQEGWRYVRRFVPVDSPLLRKILTKEEQAQSLLSLLETHYEAIVQKVKEQHS